MNDATTKPTRRDVCAATTLALFAALVAAAVLAAGAPAAAAEGPAPGAAPPDVAAIAAGLPPLPRHDGVVVLPLAAAAEGSPAAWTPIRPGVEVAGGEGALAVHFTVVIGAPSGAALIVPPGTLAGVERLRVLAGADRNAQMVVSLQEAGGAAFALPAVPLRVGNPREHLLDLADARYLAPQSTAPDPGRGIDPGAVVMITLLDLTGFTSAETPRVEWVIERFEGVAP